MNVEQMLPFENKVANYVNSTGGHVLYRVTPIFDGNNLLASGIEIEAKSVEDNGSGISFHVYVYNVQPGVTIDYATGSSRLADNSSVAQQQSSIENIQTRLMPTETPEQIQTAAQEQGQSAIQSASTEYVYVLNKNTKVFHYPTCSSINQMKEKNKIYSNQSRDEIVNAGYKSCGNCHP